MHGDEGSRKDDSYNHDELYAGLHAVERQDKRGVSQPLESKITTEVVCRKFSNAWRLKHFGGSSIKSICMVLTVLIHNVKTKCWVDVSIGGSFASAGWHMCRSTGIYLVIYRSFSLHAISFKNLG